MAAMQTAPFAMQESASRGRRYPEPKHPYRGEYARDRDRIIHARAFRRLEAKTQVFTTRYSDHFRNRLTHTLEVSQIARTVAGALALHTDLVEALALVHDIGHPPFGHAGERCLDALMREVGERFDHNLHALRIVEQFERRYLDFPGLNLTFEVREGIIKHSRDYAPQELPGLTEYQLGQRPPLEAQLIDLVDAIAYNTADLDDGFEARLLDLETICEGVPAFAAAYVEVEQRWPRGRTLLKFNEALKRILDQFATDLIDHTREEVRSSGVASVEDVRRHPVRLASFSSGVASRIAALKGFLHAQLYGKPVIVEERERSVDALEQLFRFYLDHPDRMPKFYAEQVRSEAGSRHRVVCDYIAGMTDHYLLRLHRELLGVGAARA